jgi:hypothetical protein
MSAHKNGAFSVKVNYINTLNRSALKKVERLGICKCFIHYTLSVPLFSVVERFLERLNLSEPIIVSAVANAQFSISLSRFVRACYGL